MISIKQFLLGVLCFTTTTVQASTMDYINFADLQLPTRPNFYLMCPQHYCEQPSTIKSPLFPVSATKLREVFDSMVVAEPRTAIIQSSQQKVAGEVVTQTIYRQRSRIFRFPDYVYVDFIPRAANQSTLAIFSRAKYGYSDMGVNQRRVHRWVERVAELILGKKQTLRALSRTE